MVSKDMWVVCSDFGVDWEWYLDRVVAACQLFAACCGFLGVYLLVLDVCRILKKSIIQISPPTSGSTRGSPLYA